MIYLSFFNSSEGIVYNVDEMTGGLVISHRLRLPTRDYPGIFSAWRDRFANSLQMEVQFVCVNYFLNYATKI